MPAHKKTKAKNPWDTKDFHDQMRRTTSFRVTDTDETHVYVSVSMCIPKAELSLESEEARRDAAEFGDKGVAYTLKNEVCGYLYREHHALKNSRPEYAGTDLRAYWRLAEKVFAGHKKLPEPLRTDWDEVLSGAVGTIVMVGSDDADRASGVRSMAVHLGRAVVEVSAITEDRTPVAHDMLHLAIEAGHAIRSVTYVTDLDRSHERDFKGKAEAQKLLDTVLNALGSSRKDSILVLGYRDLSDVPVSVWEHPDTRFLFPDRVGCTGFGQGCRD